jgi:hypothetical protein
LLSFERKIHTDKFNRLDTRSNLKARRFTAFTISRTIWRSFLRAEFGTAIKNALRFGSACRK